MEKRQYILNLKSYCNENNISFYDYYYQVAVKMKENPNCQLESFEMGNPFLTTADYDKLLSSTDDRICEYFALAMEKVILLNLDIMAKESVKANLISKEEPIDLDYEEPIQLDQEDAIQLDHEDAIQLDHEEPIQLDHEDAIQLDHEEPIQLNHEEPVLLEDKNADQLSLTADEKPLLENRVAGLLEDSGVKLLTRGDIEDVVNDEMNEMEDGLSREEIADVIADEMNGLDEDLSREDIEGIISDEMDGLENGISREDIVGVIVDEMDGIDKDLSREEIVDVINNELGFASKISNFFVKIGKGLSNLLNGFAVFRDEEKKESNLYLYNAETGNLSGRKSVPFEELDASTGIYVNYQEYLDKLFDDILNRYPDADSFSFADEEGNEKTFPELTEEAYQTLIQFGSVRFGDEFANSQPKTYQELVEMNVEGRSTYCGAELRKGIFVRRDVLNDIFSKYQVKATYYPQKDTEKEYVK